MGRRVRPGAGTPPAASDGETERLRRRLALLERELEESRESERRLRESEDRLARFAANVSDVLSSYDLIGQTHAFVSPSFERLTGYPVAELLADPPGLARRMTWPEDLDRVIRAVSTHAATGPEGDPLKIEYRLVRRDGRVIWISETITREFGPNGKAVSANSVIRDISERQRAEDRFQRFASAVTDVIYRFDLTTQKYDFISPSCRRLTGYSVEELMADPYVIVDRAIHPNDRELVLETARAHLKRGPGAGPISVDYRIVAKDGRIVWVSETIDYDFTADGQAASVNSVIHDSTARKQAEAERERLIVELESKNAELERFAYTVSHDLKSPLITITGFLGALEDDLASGDAEQASADIQRIARAARRIQQLLYDLL